jgi:hypothetical protein
LTPDGVRERFQAGIVARGVGEAGRLARSVELNITTGGNRMARKILVATVLAMGLDEGFVRGQTEPRAFFQDHVKLTDSEIQTMEQGQVVTKILASGDTTYGILVFGGVYINAPISKFADAYRDVNKLQGEKAYLAVQDFCRAGAPPKLSDFDRLEVERKDIDELEHCRPSRAQKTSSTGRKSTSGKGPLCA